jgi:FtsP/CotA-like multicopper oxidase with cupredoxin domain
MPSRRDVLRLGLLSSLGTGAAFLNSKGNLGSVIADDALPPSPKLTPFIMPLPIPPVAKAAATDAEKFTLFQRPTSREFPDDCSLYCGPGTKYYRFVQEQRAVMIHPHLKPTWTWGYRDELGYAQSSWPCGMGPTIRARVGGAAPGLGGIAIRMRNNLPTPANSMVRFGVNQCTTHFHGGHQPAIADGFPTNLPGAHQPRILTRPGEAFDYVLPLLDVGHSTGKPDPGERGSTLWYHDHPLHYTAQNVYSGMAGMFIVSDELDEGNENLNNGVNLRLPSGAYDIPLVLQDKRVDVNGQLYYNPLDHDGFLGDTFLVNGAVQPYLTVQRRKYRFRVLNGSNARFYRMYLNYADGTTVPFDQIGTEGGLLSRPIRGRRNFQVGPAERVEMVVDFSAFPDGTILYFENRQGQSEGRKPDEGVLPRGPGILQIRVQGTQPMADPSRVPDVLRPFAAITPAQIAAAKRREFKFGRTDGMWAINERFFDEEHPMVTPIENQPEIWTLRSGGGWAHPVHLHSEYVRVLKRDGKLPPLWERDGIARKDTVIIGGPDFKDVEIYVHFRDFLGAFVFHCHTTEHEDMDMMARVDIIK